MRRRLVVLGLMVLAGTPRADAADGSVSSRVLALLAAAGSAARVVADRMPPTLDALASADDPAPDTRLVDRPETFRAFALSYELMAGLDWATTRAALDRGGRELNPVLEPVVSSGPGFAAAKTVMTVATIYAAQRLWKRHRMAAVITMTAANIVTASIAVHNTTINPRIH